MSLALSELPLLLVEILCFRLPILSSSLYYFAWNSNRRNLSTAIDNDLLEVFACQSHV